MKCAITLCKLRISLGLNIIGNNCDDKNPIKYITKILLFLDILLRKCYFILLYVEQ